ncbi:MAG: ATP-dependent helicase [Solirubrobacteraceae bacterium]
MFVPVEMTSEPAWLADLNPEQRAAAEYDGGHLLVVAGAGTGKTTTLCARVARLVDSGVSPERILLLTFSRRAAREMIARAAALTGAHPGSGARRVAGGTFHATAHRFVRIDAVALGLSADFGLLDAGDAADLIDLVRQEQGHAETGRRFPRKHTLADIYSRAVNAQRPVREVIAEAFPWCAEHTDDLAGLFRAYTARKRALGVLDLDDLLLYWRALARDPHAGARLGERFDHVLVDEYQDVNELQVEVVDALATHGATVTAVGDDFQAIYGFRSASAAHILGFAARFPGAGTVVLERNYRGSQPLLDLANAVGAQAAEGHPKTLRAAREGGARPELVFCRDQTQEAAEVCDRVLAARERGMLLRDQAVLARTGHDTDLLELELSRRRIPFVKYGGLRYLEAAHVKDFLALLRLADRVADEMSWFRLLMLLDDVGPARARRALGRLLAGDLLSASQLPERWAAAREQLPAAARGQGDALAAALAAGPDAERLRDALAPVVRAHYPDGAVRVQDLDALCGLASTARDLRTFVAELLLDPPASSADLAGPPHHDDDWLVLSTVHSAKGLEWEAVHVIAAYDGNFPSDLAAGTKESLAEERRLMYVALTRPRRSLTVYVPRRFYFRADRRDGHGYGKASRFLGAAAQACCEVVHLPDDPAVAAMSGAAGPRRIAVSVDDLFA